MQQGNIRNTAAFSIYKDILFIHFFKRMKGSIMKKKKIYFAAIGALAGIINGLLGAGGGIIAVPMLYKSGIETKKAHATSIALILPLSIVSSIFYIINGNVEIGSALSFIPAGLAGALIGAFLLKKISSVWLKRIFGAFMIFSGVRMFLR